LVADRAFLDLCWIGHDLISRSIIQEAKLLLMCYGPVGPLTTAGFLDMQYSPIHAPILETYKSKPKLLYTVGFPTHFLSALLLSQHASLQHFCLSMLSYFSYGTDFIFGCTDLCTRLSSRRKTLLPRRSPFPFPLASFKSTLDYLSRLPSPL
jgi:hypothetical protein